MTNKIIIGVAVLAALAAGTYFMTVEEEVTPQKDGGPIDCVQAPCRGIDDTY